MLGLSADYFIRRSKLDEDGCRIWVGATINSGYGKLGVAGKTITAHKAAYLHYHGEIPEGFVVSHRCDKRLCVNKECLVAKTQQSNIQEMWDKGRQASHLQLGENHSASKLSDKEVWQIKDLCKAGPYYHREIAEMYGMARATVVMIGNGTRRQKVPNPYLKV